MKFQMLCMMALAVQQSNQFIFMFGNLLNGLTGSNLFHTDMAPRGKVTVRRDVNGRPGPIVETLEFDDPRVMNKVRFNTHCKNKNCHNPWSSRRVDRKQQITNINNEQSISDTNGMSDITEIDGSNNINELIRKKKLQFGENVINNGRRQDIQEEEQEDNEQDDLNQILLKKRKKNNNNKRRKTVNRVDLQDIQEEDNNVYTNQQVQENINTNRRESSNTNMKRRIDTKGGNNYNIFILPKDQKRLITGTQQQEGNQQQVITKLLEKLSKSSSSSSSSSSTKFNKLDTNQLIKTLSSGDFPDIVVKNQKVPKSNFLEILQNSDIYLNGERTDSSAFLQALNKGFSSQDSQQSEGGIDNETLMNLIMQSKNMSNKKKSTVKRKVVKKKGNKVNKVNIKRNVRDISTGSEQQQDQSDQNQQDGQYQTNDATQEQEEDDDTIQS